MTHYPGALDTLQLHLFQPSSKYVPSVPPGGAQGSHISKEVQNLMAKPSLSLSGKGKTWTSGIHSLIHTVSHAWSSLTQSHFVLSLRSVKKNQPRRAECNCQLPSTLLRLKTKIKLKLKKPKPKANNWVYVLLKLVL